MKTIIFKMTLFALFLIFKSNDLHAIQIDSIQSRVACDCNANPSYLPGYIKIFASGGVSPYQYSIDNGGTFFLSNTFNGLCGKIYNVKIKDANGIADTISVNILKSPVCNAPSLPFILGDTVLHPSVYGANPCTGIDSIIIAGGVPPYQLMLKDITGNTIHGWQSSQTFDSLCKGSYLVFIKDAASVLRDSLCPPCDSLSNAGGTAYIINIPGICFGGNFNFTGDTCYVPGNNIFVQAIPILPPNITLYPAFVNWSYNGVSIFSSALTDNYQVPISSTGPLTITCTVIDSFNCMHYGTTTIPRCFSETPDGIDENIQNKIRIFPQPANNYLIVENEENLFLQDYQIIDLVGKGIISEGKTQMENNKSTILLSDLPNGIYILNLYGENKTLLKRAKIIIYK